jgi:hypothetical protein
VERELNWTLLHFRAVIIWYYAYVMTHSVQTGSGRTFIVLGCYRNTLFHCDCNENELVWSCRNNLFAYICHGNKLSANVVKISYIFGLSHRLFDFVFSSSYQIILWLALYQVRFSCSH